MQREQVLATVVAAAALLSFGLAADGLRTEPPPVGREFEPGADSGYEPPDLGFTWNTPDCAACSDAVPLLNRAVRSLPPTALVGLAVLALGALGGALVLRDGDDDESPAVEDTTERRGRTPAGGAPDAAPGPLAADPENAVEGAWLSLAERVDDAVDRGRTPREYAARAREAGLDADAVERITALFREVRYGGRPVTDDRERAASRAREALDGEADGGHRGPDDGTGGADGGGSR